MKLGRRRLLAGASAIAVTTVAGCRGPTTSEPTASASTPAPSPVAPTATSSSTTTTPTASASPLDWAELRRTLGERLVLPADPGYDGARLLYNTRFDGLRPQAVARCASAADVRECVLFARRHALPLAVRSGGHSYAGRSSGPGLVIDMRGMSSVDVQGGTVRVGAGAPLVAVYAALAQRGLGIAAGSCPTVGISGITLAGGLGVLTRAWGLTCDGLVAADVVTSDGAVRTCDEGREPDLFWALRGGNGGVGVVTSLTFRARQIARLSLGFLRWDPERSRDVVRAWQAWIAAAPDELWSNLHLEAAPGALPEIAVHAVHLGDVAALGNALDRLSRAVGAAPTYREAGSLPYLDAMLLEAGCLGRSAAQCGLVGSSGGTVDRETYAGTSVVAERAMSDAAIDALVDGLGRLSSPAGSAAVIMDALGGAAGRVAPDATAFPHRRALASVQILSLWAPTAPAATADASRAWLRGYRDDSRARIGPGAYAGYFDPDLARDAYFGGNDARLRRIAAAYDPSALFAPPA